ncbi:GNAT family N-acetyltransferase [Cognatiluteimonas telluris]|jgi:predicted GNAT family acetyltransferase|uniref:GNAT family N-acetyltransferase n=1 Tax=Cognatiluteimonas telluris TaxID=1104775 RepID=UPI00140E79F1|nr:GNAT family N-acetyltransferase [Lysobacter telluris]
MREGLDIRHDAAQQRFETTVDGVRAELDYEQRGDVLSLTHTGVPAAIGGRGVAGALVRSALEYARSKGLKVVPSCAYAARYIERHPQYQDLLTS